MSQSKKISISGEAMELANKLLQRWDLHLIEGQRLRDLEDDQRRLTTMTPENQKIGHEMLYPRRPYPIEQQALDFLQTCCRFPGSSLSSLTPGITYDEFGERFCLYLDKWPPRLGNQFRGLQNAIMIARYFGIKRIYTSNVSPLLKFDNEFIVHGAPKRNDKVYVAPINKHGFFYTDCSFLYKNDWCLDFSLDIIDSRIRIDYRPVDIPEDDLVIHIRSSDIFTDNPNNKYSQPPLAWYIICIEEHLKYHKNASFIAVFADTKNPCIHALIDYCKNNNIKLKTQSGDLKSDYGYIMEATSLVSARGSFLRPALMLSKKLKRVYRFDFNYCAEGVYFAKDEWMCNPEQLEKMVSLPKEAINYPSNLYEISEFIPRRDAIMLPHLQKKG